MNISRELITEVDFIKIDVEGAEVDVLRGARNLLQKLASDGRSCWLRFSTRERSPGAIPPVTLSSFSNDPGMSGSG